MNDKFDPFEEFNNEIESQGNQIFDMRLIHNKSRENLNNKKVACMDKILDDIKKRYEYETELNQHTDSNNDESKISAMRDKMKELGKDPQKINPIIPTEMVIDHSVIVDYARDKDAWIKNEELEFSRNKERFQFLKWAKNQFKNFLFKNLNNYIVLSFASEG